MLWTDTGEIAAALFDAHGEIDPLRIRFTDLYRWVTELPEFEDDPQRSNERSWRPSRWPGSTRHSERICRKATNGPRCRFPFQGGWLRRGESGEWSGGSRLWPLGTRVAVCQPCPID